MSVPVRVHESTDPRLYDYTALTDVELRRRREPAEGLFIAEGEKVIRRACRRLRDAVDAALREVAAALRDVIDEVPAPVYVVRTRCAERVTGYHVHRGALASMQRKALPDGGRPAPRPPGGGHGVGQRPHQHRRIFRSAAALGMDAVLLSPDCADPLYRRSVKVSMGAVFSVPYARLDAWPRAGTVPGGRLHLLAFTPDEGRPLAEAAAANSGPLRADARRRGRPGHPAALAAADLVRIPMSHGVDSLNVGAAAAVAFYAVGPA